MRAKIRSANRHESPCMRARSLNTTISFLLPQPTQTFTSQSYSLCFAIMPSASPSSSAASTSCSLPRAGPANRDIIVVQCMESTPNAMWAVVQCVYNACTMCVQCVYNVSAWCCSMACMRRALLPGVRAASANESSCVMCARSPCFATNESSHGAGLGRRFVHLADSGQRRSGRALGQGRHRLPGAGACAAAEEMQCTEQIVRTHVGSFAHMFPPVGKNTPWCGVGPGSWSGEKRREEVKREDERV